MWSIFGPNILEIVHAMTNVSLAVSSKYDTSCNALCSLVQPWTSATVRKCRNHAGQFNDLLLNLWIGAAADRYPWSVSGEKRCIRASASGVVTGATGVGGWAVCRRVGPGRCLSSVNKVWTLLVVGNLSQPPGRHAERSRCPPRWSQCRRHALEFCQRYGRMRRID